MKNSLYSLRRQLRWTQAALALTVAALLCAATPAVRPLFLAAGTNQPTAPVSLAGANWTGTLDAGRLPGTVKFNNVITPNLTSPNGPLQVGASGNDTLSLVGGVSEGGGINLYTIDALPLASFDAPTGSLTLNRGDGGNLRMAGYLDVDGPISGDGGRVSTDGEGGLTAASLNVGGFSIGDRGIVFPVSTYGESLSLYTDGTQLYFVDQNGNTYTINLTPFSTGG